MKVVLDTNCFLSCIGKRSPYRNVFDAYLEQRFSLCLSTDILLEYEEKFTLFWGEEVTANLLGRLLAGTNTSFHSIYYNFLLVRQDPDDNKFVDTYLAANAEYLVSNDNDLLALQIFFPAGKCRDFTSVFVATCQQNSMIRRFMLWPVGSTLSIKEQHLHIPGKTNVGTISVLH